jgi:hypothetical protein
MERFTLDITTDGSGNATAYTGDVSGRVVALRYVPDGTTPLDTGADLTITGSVSGVAILTATDIGLSAKEWYPRAAVCTVAGAAALFASGGTAVVDGIPVADESIKVVVAQGGAAKQGTLHCYLI